MTDRICIVVGRFNEMICQHLLSGALNELEHSGQTPETHVDIHWAPGAFELPLIAKLAAKSGRYRGVICLGAVIRGATPHFDYVCGPTASGIMNAMLETEIPIAFGVLTTDTVDQALDRAGLKHGNKGRDAASTLLQMIKTVASIESNNRD